jgi:hypothetical protein
MFLERLGAATLAAALALLGNYLLLRFQTKTKVREERRAFVRELHSHTVDMVVDLDLFVRSLRSAVITGTTSDEHREQVKEIIESRWEGDLLRRVRRARYGHPDPDVRRAAEHMDDVMWPFIVTASSAEREPDSFPPTKNRGRKTQSQGWHRASPGRAATFRLRGATSRRTRDRLFRRGHSQPLLARSGTRPSQQEQRPGTDLTRHRGQVLVFSDVEIEAQIDVTSGLTASDPPILEGTFV